MSRQSCCFCPADSDAGEGALIGPISSTTQHDTQYDTQYDKQLSAHLTCLRATSSFDAGLRSDLPQDVLQLLWRMALKAKTRL
jgi:hypothetical protein